MISDMLALDPILLQFEQILKIEYQEMGSDRIIKSAKAKLENAFQVEFNKSVYDLLAENRLVAENLNVFVEQVLDVLRSMSLYVDNCMFMAKIPFNLADVNYLGFAQESLKTALRYLQNVNSYRERDGIIPPLKAAVSNIEPCTIKRLFVILFVLDDLGMYEGAAVLARFLYLGGLT